MTPISDRWQSCIAPGEPTAQHRTPCKSKGDKQLNFGGDPDHHLDTGIVFQTRHYGKWLTDINRLLYYTDNPQSRASHKA